MCNLTWRRHKHTHTHTHARQVWNTVSQHLETWQPYWTMTSHRIVILPDKYPLFLPAVVPKCVWEDAEWPTLYTTGEPTEVTKDSGLILQYPCVNNINPLNFLKISEVKWVTVKFLGTKVPCTLGWPYTEGIWLYCDYFIWVYLVLWFFFNLFCNVWVFW
jgi:hypothetical protein